MRRCNNHQDQHREKRSDLTPRTPRRCRDRTSLKLSEPRGLRWTPRGSSRGIAPPTLGLPRRYCATNAKQMPLADPRLVEKLQTSQAALAGSGNLKLYGAYTGDLAPPAPPKSPGQKSPKLERAVSPEKAPWLGVFFPARLSPVSDCEFSGSAVHIAQWGAGHTALLARCDQHGQVRAGE
jgi:hypothetical protein